MTANLYKVGDWVYCEVSPFQPYVIRKIEELTKTPSGNVEAKVICAFRHAEIPPAVMATVEKYQQKHKIEVESKSDGGESQSGQDTQNNYFEESEVSDLNEQQRYNLRHREVYFSKYTDTIAATTIRSKCSVLLFNEEVEKYSEYLNKEDQFYYHLTYDPSQKSLVADKGEIRVGSRYQAEVPMLKFTPNGSMIEESQESQSEKIDRVLRSQQRNNSSREPEIPIAQQGDEIMTWCPLGLSLNNKINSLNDREIDQFLIIAKSVGTFARALDCNNAFKQPSLQLSAASASRDITLFHAMNALHENNYDIGKAALSLITDNGPVLCKDELEDWSAVEANLFEDALEKFGKDFAEIRREYLPWKTMRSLIEYYYSWKTTDRYLQQKRIKIAEQESKLKQVYIPNHSKQNQSALIKSSHVQLFNQYDVHLKNSCESCGAPNTSTNQWYAYQPTNLVQLIMSGNSNPTLLANAQAQAAAAQQNNTHITQCRLCAECWIYYKKFSSFKYPSAKYEKNIQNKNQVHKCSVNGCGKEFKMKQLLIKHCGIAHGYFAKSNNPPAQNERPAIRNRTAFYLLTTPMTRAARLVATEAIKLKKLARKPFKLVDLSELNKEWTRESRNIRDLLDKTKKKSNQVKKFLDVKLISKIAKNRARLLKKGSNEDDENSNDLIISDEDGDKPEFLKYFEKKCTTPCYVPEKLAYPKPSYEQINKFHLNLVSQSRKRPHEPSNAESTQVKIPNGSENDSNDSSPQSKRTLLAPKQPKFPNNIPANNNNNTSSANNVNVNTTNDNATKQVVSRSAQKSLKPTSSSNMSNSPKNIYYLAMPNVKNIRKEIDGVALRKIARKPYRLLGSQYEDMYKTLERVFTEKSSKKLGSDELNMNETSNDTIQSNKIDKVDDHENDSANLVVLD
ncbi:unnamed protein product [Brachionus calyciflorus]|uniref:Metastasis-associated protein MTA3 n=1 Tax=Brachionus calyciflorus TaxID=104777 RepID=A0A813M109_9BILA|nr:unnamed protein product [Brachionus calyciflorus]